MLRKKKSFSVKNFVDEKYVLALRDRTIEEEKYNDYRKKLDLVNRHLREEELKWQKSEVRAFDKKHLAFDEEKLEEIEPYESLEFDTLADVLALGTAQLNLQKVLAIQSQLMGLYEHGFDILNDCIETANEEKQCLSKSFMASIHDSPYLLNTKRNFDNKAKHDHLKQQLSEVVITVSELKEKIEEHSKALKAEKVVLDDERKILFNREVITDQSSIERLKPIYQQVGHEDTKLNEHLVVYNSYEKVRLQKEKAIEEKSVERLALEFRAIYGGVTGVTSTSSSASHSSNHTGSTSANTTNSSSSNGAPPAPLSSPAAPGTNTTSVNPYGTDAADYEYLTEAIHIYEKEFIDYQELAKYYEIQEKALAEAVKHAKSEIKYLREGRVLKSYAYYDEIAKQWTETNAKIEKIRKNINNLVNNINIQDKKIATDSTNMLKSFKAVTEGLPNKRSVYRFLHSESYQTLLSMVKTPIQKAKELHVQRNEETNQFQAKKANKEQHMEQLLQNRDEVIESMNQAKKTFHKYQKSLETYDNTIKALDAGKTLGNETLDKALQLLNHLEDEQMTLFHLQNLQKEEESFTQQAIEKIEILEDRIDCEKHQATYHTAFGGIMLGGGDGNIEALATLRTLRDKNQPNIRTLRIQQIVDSRARMHLLNNLKFLCKQEKLYFKDLNDVTSDQYSDVIYERNVVGKAKVVYQLEESINIHSQIHLEKARRVLPYHHSSAYALVFLPYRGKISQSITAPIPVTSTAASNNPTSIPVAQERVVRRKSTSIEPGIVSKMKRTHSLLARKGSVKNMFEDDDHSESGITVGSGNSTLASMLAAANGSQSSSLQKPESDHSKEIQAIENALQKLYRYEQELISDNMKVMTDVSNLLQTPAGKRLLEHKEEKWIQKAFFPETEFDAIVSKFELLSKFPELFGKSAFYVDYNREVPSATSGESEKGGVGGSAKAGASNTVSGKEK